MPPPSESFKAWADLVTGFISTAALIIGGLIALYEWRRFRRFSAKVEMDVDFTTSALPGTPGARLVDVAITVKNLSQVRNYFPDIELGVKGLQAQDVQAALDGGRRLKFGVELIPRHNIMPKPEDPWWVDGGVSQVFRYPVVIREAADFVQVNVSFDYFRDKKCRKKTGYHQGTRIHPLGAG